MNSKQTSKHIFTGDMQFPKFPQFFHEHSTWKVSFSIPIFGPQKDKNQDQHQNISALICVKLTSIPKHPQCEKWQYISILFQRCCAALNTLLDSHKTILGQISYILYLSYIWLKLKHIIYSYTIPHLFKPFVSIAKRVLAAPRH